MQAMHGLKILAEARKTTVTEVMEPHRDVLQDMVPPKKHLLRHQPANAQIGIMVRYMPSLYFILLTIFMSRTQCLSGSLFTFSDWLNHDFLELKH